MMQLIEVEISPNTRIRDEVGPRVILGTVNIVVKVMTKATVQYLVRNAPNVAKRTISKLCTKAMVQVINVTKAGLGLRKARRAKSSMR